MQDLDLLANEVLSAIEIAEAGMLNWGFVEVRSNLDRDLPALLESLPPLAADLWAAAKRDGVRPEDILANLLARKLVFRGDGFYRSRFAEAVRLLYLLRQRFSAEDWQTAPRLVSDLKIQLQRRRYPKRNVDSEELLTKLQLLPVDSDRMALVKTLLQTPEGKPIRLAGFQEDAIIQQFRNLRDSDDHALVVGAGTGAGKTKAFYIPALAEIAATLTDAAAVQALALYPRIELLKDQLAEALAEARKLDPLLAQRHKRRLVVSAYYGDTPVSAAYFLKFPLPNWKQSADKSGWICPFLSCPVCQGNAGALIWSQGDLEREAEENKAGRYGRYARLRCPSCEFEIGSDRLLLAREQMIRQPPDILFTTTEMLNRRLSRVREQALFGVNTSTPPRLMLLDEIHTYEDMTGAQVAYLLRRWRFARGRRVGRSLCLVGLSATLSEAESFFAKLTGLPLSAVTYIQPEEADLVEEGLEYNLVLKGDPVSSTSLLSTSVQTVMLLGRVLDPFTAQPGKASISHNTYGQRVFAFTDKLDVINRWFHIGYDAEFNKKLSQWRLDNAQFTATERLRRAAAGQIWTICGSIGHDLEAPLRLALTSSQHQGVDPAAKIIIATSTLEVGFNDPTVGMVVQHKAPRSLASFLQRKGRAGRTRAMRPWMVVVTSAYGRDRWAFQHAENLFSPTLLPLNLPLDNYYVRKIQASYILMDWLAKNLRTKRPPVDVWDLLCSNDRGKWQESASQRALLAAKLRRILDGSAREQFTKYLGGALGLSKNEVDKIIPSLLWGEPRSLLFEVIPTLLRQLESNWQEVAGGQVQPWSDSISPNPMPDFVPSNLFSDLSLPELGLNIPVLAKPSSTRPTNRSYKSPAPNVAKAGPMQPSSREEFMALAAGMTEFAPGHVSKRYARPEPITEAHWLALPDDAQLTRGALPLQYLAINRDPLPLVLTVGAETYQIYRPRTYTLALVPDSVKPTSSARLLWQSHFAPGNAHVTPSSTDTTSTVDPPPAATTLSLTTLSPWRRFFSNVRSYTQVNGAWVMVTRLATHVAVDTRYTNGSERRRTFYFEEDAQPAALGFRTAVDALEWEFVPLDVVALRSHADWPHLYAHLGPEYFLDRLRRDVRLQEAGLSSFDIQWLWQLELSMLLAVAVAKHIDLPLAATEVANNQVLLAERTLHVIFQSQEIEDEEDEKVGRLHKKLLGYVNDRVVQSALQDQITVLWNPDDADLTTWLQRTYAASLGTTLFTALTRLVPDSDPDELLLDVADDRIWISEATAGGTGLITRIADTIAQHPQDFDLQMQDTVQNCDREQLAIQLRAVADLIGHNDAALQTTFAAVRAAADLPQQATTRRQLAHILEDAGIAATRDLIVGINTKFLRPNSGLDSDALIATLARHWVEEEARLGCAIDVRVMAVAARKIPEVEQQLRVLLNRIGGVGTTADESQIFNLLQSLLWLSCVNSCPDCIEQSSRYQELARPSRGLLLILLDFYTASIRYDDPNWLDEVRTRLTTGAQANIWCEQDQLESCKTYLLDLLTAPTEVGFQLFYPTIIRITRYRREWVIHLALRELIRN